MAALQPDSFIMSILAFREPFLIPQRVCMCNCMRTISLRKEEVLHHVLLLASFFS